MAKPRSLIRDYAAYLAVRVVVCLIQALSFRVACGFAALLAWVLYHVDKRHRLVALDNLRQAFPGRYSEAELDRLVRGVYRHFCLVLIEIVQLPRRLHPSNWHRWVKPHGARKLAEVLLSDRPLLLVTGHFGNWEMAGYTLALLGVRTHAIARELDNPFLDRYLRQFRERTGQRILAKKGEFDKIQEVLHGGGILATLGDQDAGQRGLFVDFFGRPASTHKAVALMALELGAVMVVVGTPRVGDHYEPYFADVIYPEEYDGRTDAVRALTQRFTSGLEQLIRQFPEQYFWLHRRWKHQPVKRQGQRAA